MLTARFYACLAILSIGLHIGTCQLPAPVVEQTSAPETGLTLKVTEPAASTGLEFKFQMKDASGIVLEEKIQPGVEVVLTDCRIKSISVVYAKNLESSAVKNLPVEGDIFTRPPPQPVLGEPQIIQPNVETPLGSGGSWYSPLTYASTLKVSESQTIDGPDLPLSADRIVAPTCLYTTLSVYSVTECGVRSLPAVSMTAELLKDQCNTAPSVTTENVPDGVKVFPLRVWPGDGITFTYIGLTDNKMLPPTSSASKNGFFKTCKITAALASYTKAGKPSFFKYVDLTKTKLHATPPQPIDTEITQLRCDRLLVFKNGPWFEPLENMCKSETGGVSGKCLPSGFMIDDQKIVAVTAVTPCGKSSLNSIISTGAEPSTSCLPPPTVSKSETAATGVTMQASAGSRQRTTAVEYSYQLQTTSGGIGEPQTSPHGLINIRDCDVAAVLVGYTMDIKTSELESIDLSGTVLNKPPPKPMTSVAGTGAEQRLTTEVDEWFQAIVFEYALLTSADETPTEFTLMSGNELSFDATAIRKVAIRAVTPCGKRSEIDEVVITGSEEGAGLMLRGNPLIVVLALLASVMAVRVF